MPNFDIEQAIVNAFEGILTALKDLEGHVNTLLVNLPVWVDNGQGELIADRGKAVEALTAFKPAEGLMPQETVACVGAIACVEETLPLIERVNKAKDKLKGIVDLYLEHYQADRSRDTAVIRKLLKAHGYPLIKLKQVYRHIRYLHYHPRRISFNLATHSSHKVITRKQAEALLVGLGQGENIDIQLNLLKQIHPKEKLVVYHDVPKCWIVNIASFKNEQGRCDNEQYRTSIPLFYVHHSQQETPQVGFSKKTHRHKAGARADKRVEEEPFLVSIKAYRYRIKK